QTRTNTESTIFETLRPYVKKIRSCEGSGVCLSRLGPRWPCGYSNADQLVVPKRCQLQRGYSSGRNRRRWCPVFASSGDQSLQHDSYPCHHRFRLEWRPVRQNRSSFARLRGGKGKCCPFLRCRIIGETSLAIAASCS